MFNTLVGGIRVVTDAGVDALHLICRNTCSHPGPAQQNPTSSPAGQDGVPDLLGEIRIITGFGGIRTQVKDFMPCVPNSFENGPPNSPETLQPDAYCQLPMIFP